ncbi:epithelial sodium channel subunit beta-2-like, partial [Saccoglossus kowalevskii]
MWGIFLWQGSLEVKKYFNYDVTYDIAVVFRELPFPAVTICNLNPLRQSKLGDLGTEYLNELGFLDFDTTDDNQTSEFDWNAEIPVDSDWDDDSNFFDGFDDEYAAEINLTRIMSILDPSLRKSVGHQSKDFIQECTFNGGKCSTANFTLVLNSKYGNCFSFNTGINDSEILSTVRPGPTRGLTLTLFIEQDEYLTDYTENAGAVVLVHPHSIVAFPEEQGIEVPPGFSTSIGVRLSEIIRKGGDYSDCTDGTDIDMLYDDDYSYSREACLSSCLQQALIDTCLCYEPTLPHSADVEMCSKVSGGTTCQAGVTNQHNKNQLGCTDTCPPSCNDRTYETVVSMSQWPSEAYDDTLFRRLSKRSSKIQDQLGSIEDSRRNLIQLKVYYQELNYQSITEKPALDETGLLSNLGGL